MTIEIKKPIILLGTGRCGSTALHKLLSLHPNVAWLSRLSNRFPNRPKYDFWLMRSFDLPLVGHLLNRRFNPSEGYFFWQRYAPAFRQPFRDLMAEDVTNREKSCMPGNGADINKPTQSLVDQDHRLAQNWVLERDLCRCKVHPHRTRWQGRCQFHARGTFLGWMARTRALALEPPHP